MKMIIVEAVEELWVEGALHLVLHQLFHLFHDQVVAVGLETQSLLLLQMPRADV